MWEFHVICCIAAKRTDHTFWSVLLPTAVRGSDWRCRAVNSHLINQHIPVYLRHQDITPAHKARTQEEEDKETQPRSAANALRFIFLRDRNVLGTRWIWLFILHHVLPFSPCWRVWTLIHKTAQKKVIPKQSVHYSISEKVNPRTIGTGGVWCIVSWMKAVWVCFYCPIAELLTEENWQIEIPKHLLYFPCMKSIIVWAR